MHDHNEHLDKIASASSCRIRLCPCGTIQLGLGASTIKIAPEAFLALSRAMQVVASRIESTTKGPRLVPVPGGKDLL